MNDPWFDSFRYTMHMVIKSIAARHLSELRRTWKTQDFVNRSAGQKRRWAVQKGQS